MYNSRSKHYKKQILREDIVEDSEPPSAPASRESSPSESVRTKRSKREPTTQPNGQLQEYSSLYKKAEYSDNKDLKFISKLTWNPYPEKTVLELRNILADSYDKSLSAIAGSSEDNMNEDFKRDLKNLARNVNKAVKGLLVPGIVDENILDPRMANVKLKLLTEIKAKKLDLAKDELYLEHCERTVKKKNEEIELLEKQLQQEKDKLALQNHQNKDKPQDYLHRIMMEPTSSFFTSPQ